MIDKKVEGLPVEESKTKYLWYFIGTVVVALVSALVASTFIGDYAGWVGGGVTFLGVSYTIYKARK